MTGCDVRPLITYFCCSEAKCRMSHTTESLRKIILQAPPGQLQEVLKALHVVCGGSEQFFSTAPDVCLEYCMRNHVTVPLLMQDKDARSTAYNVLCCKHNHFVSTVKRIAKELGRLGDDVAKEFEVYFDEAQSTLLQGDDNQDEVSTFSRLDFVFVDFTNRLYVEIDPMEGKVVHAKPFSLLGTSDVIMRLEQPSTSVQGLHSYLNKEVANYVDACFGAEAWWRIDRQHMLSTEASPQHYNSSGLSKKRESRVSSASHVAVRSPTSLVVAVCSERYVPASRWAARWRGLFLINVNEGNDQYEAVIEGEVRVDGHYFEESNVHIHIDDTVNAMTVHATDAKKLSKAIISAIGEADSSIQAKLERSSKELGGAALKGLRRRLPVTKQLFDFQKAMMQVPPLDERD